MNYSIGILPPGVFGSIGSAPAPIRLGPNAGVGILPPTHGGNVAGHIGGIAPGQQTVGVTRDFSFGSRFNPALLINGGLKTPPRF